MSVTYIGPKSRTEKPRKTKIGTQVAHITCDSDTTFKVKGQLAGGGGILWQPPAQLVIVTLTGSRSTVAWWECTSLKTVAELQQLALFTSSTVLV